MAQQGKDSFRENLHKGFVKGKLGNNIDEFITKEGSNNSFLDG
jgi:hypothetical protein